MNTQSISDLMQKIQLDILNIYETNKLSSLGYKTCEIFGNYLKPHDILFVGINPGDTKADNVELNNFTELNNVISNPDYNELLDPKNDYLRFHEFYKIAFGEDDYLKKLKNTFYWNLCPFRNEKYYSEWKDKYKVFEKCYTVLLEIIKNIKPKIILSFIAVFKFLQNKNKFKITSSKLNPVQNVYFLKSENIIFNDNKINYLLGIPHTKKYRYYSETRETFAKEFGKIYNSFLT